MLGFTKPAADRSIDPVSAQVLIAVQRNEQASQRTRDLLKDMLDENDRVKGGNNA